MAKQKISINGAALTPREVETVKHLASDKPDKQIAHEMGISTHTLVQHKANVYRKADVQSRPGLITKAFNQSI
ncbi:helix-turn-helix transcriptional regulator [Flavobacterium sp. RHBU_24]|uniref:helix-turn-helix transcriptional regulator n=1 Tax=Flavobacterium sp. RHBU_24 TaxID=3391185 RepID=UPI0039850BAA